MGILLNPVLDGLSSLVMALLFSVWQIFDRMMERMWRTMVAASVFCLIVNIFMPPPSHKPISAPVPAATPASPAPEATVLYPPNYNGPDMYGVPQNK